MPSLCGCRRQVWLTGEDLRDGQLAVELEERQSAAVSVVRCRLTGDPLIFSGCRVVRMK